MQAGAAFYWLNLYYDGVQDDAIKRIMKDELPSVHKNIVCVGDETSIQMMRDVALKPTSLPDTITISYQTYTLYGNKQKDYESMVDHKAGSVYLYGILMVLYLNSLPT